MFRFNFYWMYGIIFLLLIALYMGNDAASSKELGWTEFQKLAAENTFEQMTVFNKRNVVEATVRSNKIEEVFGSNYDYKKIWKRYLNEGKRVPVFFMRRNGDDGPIDAIGLAYMFRFPTANFIKGAIPIELQSNRRIYKKTITGRYSNRSDKYKRICRPI